MVALAAMVARDAFVRTSMLFSLRRSLRAVVPKLRKHQSIYSASASQRSSGHPRAEAARAGVPLDVGRRSRGGRQEAHRTQQRTASSPPRASCGGARPRHFACTSRCAAESTRVSDGALGASEGGASGHVTLSGAALLRAARSCASRVRSGRQAGVVERCARLGDSHCDLRQRSAAATWVILGGSLAWAGAEDAAGSAKRVRLRAREFSKTCARAAERTPCDSVRHRSVFVGGLVRRVSRMRHGLRPAAAVCRARGAGRLARHRRRDRGARALVARPCRVAPARSHRHRRSSRVASAVAHAARRTPHVARRTPHVGRRTPHAARRTPPRRAPHAARRARVPALHQSTIYPGSSHRARCLR